MSFLFPRYHSDWISHSETHNVKMHQSQYKGNPLTFSRCAACRCVKWWWTSLRQHVKGMNWDDVAVPASSELCVDGSISICHCLGPFCHSFPPIANATEWSANGHWLHSPQPHRPACRFWWHWLLACLCYTGCQTPLFVYALTFPWQRGIMAASASAALNW